MDMLRRQRSLINIEGKGKISRQILWKILAGSVDVISSEPPILKWLV